MVEGSPHSSPWVVVVEEAGRILELAKQVVEQPVESYTRKRRI